jgi:predicted small integral membrane protein
MKTLVGSDLVRWAKLLCLLGIALHMSLVAFGNITDYGSNETFVRHVLAMDTTFKSPALMWRAITDPTVQTIAYLFIIAAETLGALLLWFGFAVLLRHRKAAPEAFHAAKGLALFALAWALAIWVIGFMAIGGEWFAMWQSETWNGQDAASQFAAMSGMTMIFLAIREY